MVHREATVCRCCGKPIEKAVYSDNSKLIGDTFIKWENIRCDCDYEEGDLGRDDEHECCDDCGCYHGHHPWCEG